MPVGVSEQHAAKSAKLKTTYRSTQGGRRADKNAPPGRLDWEKVVTIYYDIVKQWWYKSSSARHTCPLKMPKNGMSTTVNDSAIGDAVAAYLTLERHTRCFSIMLRAVQLQSQPRAFRADPGRRSRDHVYKIETRVLVGQVGWNGGTALKTMENMVDKH